MKHVVQLHDAWLQGGLQNVASSAAQAAGWHCVWVVSASAGAAAGVRLNTPAALKILPNREDNTAAFV